MRRMAVGIILLVWIAGAARGGGAEDEALAGARAAAARLSGGLMSALTEALRAGGETNALAVCHDQAQRITATIAVETGRKVRRTSLRTRNAANRPDAWERAGLEALVRRAAAGEAPEALEITEVIVADGQRVFRYLKAIPTRTMCLRCHGQAVTPEVQAEVKRLYPDDEAVGFGEGDIRGAVSVQELLPPQ